MPVIQPTIEVKGGEAVSREYQLWDYSGTTQDDYLLYIYPITTTPPSMTYVESRKRRYAWSVTVANDRVSFYGTNGIYYAASTYASRSNDGALGAVFDVTIASTYTFTTTLPNGTYDLWAVVAPSTNPVYAFQAQSTSSSYGGVNPMIHGKMVVTNGSGVWAPDITQVRTGGIWSVTSSATTVTIAPAVLVWNN